MDRIGGEIGVEVGCIMIFVCSFLIGFVGFVILESKVELFEEKVFGGFFVEYV